MSDIDSGSEYGNDDYDYTYDDDVEEVRDRDDYYDSEILLNGHIENQGPEDEQIEAEKYDATLENEDVDPNMISDDEDLEEEVDDKIQTLKVTDNRRTPSIMTKFEYSYMVSQRAMAIENNSPLMIPDTKMVHAIDIAKEETAMGLNPIIIQRVLPNGNIEEWKCSELSLPQTYNF
jgi:DNA-directed RNA polymerase subunit K/omega